MDPEIGCDSLWLVLCLVWFTRNCWIDCITESDVPAEGFATIEERSN